MRSEVVGAVRSLLPVGNLFFNVTAAGFGTVCGLTSRS